MFGTVIFYDRRKAWGFVVPDDTRLADFFVHISALPKNHRFLNGGDRIEFNAGEHGGKPCALDVKVLTLADGGELRPAAGGSNE
jgi:cold shock CspA family protein